MHKFRFEGTNLEEVIDNACDEINIDPEYLHYQVVEQSEDKVVIDAFTITEVIDYAQDYLLRIIKDYGLEGKAISTLSDGVIKITLETSHNSILIGKNGKTLQSLNEMVRNAVNYFFGERHKILLDINDYKDEKYEKIIRMAKKIARDVQKSHIDAALDPMTSDERRVIHNALSNYDHIKTESSGHGHKRQVNIIYVENKEPVETKEEEN